VSEATLAPAETSRNLPESPYKGLLPYEEGDADFFFGRETERDLITSNLLAARLTVLYGPSGVGKSSVLFAGVAHDVHERALEALDDEDRPRLALVVFRDWHDEPLRDLASALNAAVRKVLPEEPLVESKAGMPLSDVIEHWTGQLRGRLLIVLDQFEEHFLYAGSDDRFAMEFAQAANRPDLASNFLISIREDALAKLDIFKGRIPYLFDNYLRIDRLDLSAARRAIVEPLREWAERGGEAVEAEPALVDAVLDDVRPDLSFGQYGAGRAKDSARPDRIETTFLQLVMTRLWRERELDAGSLELASYDELGGAKGIVREHVNDGMSALTDEQRDVADHVVRFLVTKSGQKVAHTAADLAAFSDQPEGEVGGVLTALAAPEVRILRRVDAAPGQEAEGPRYEIYLDTLGEAILDWRARHVEEEQQKRAQAEARELLRREARKRRRRNIWIALTSFAVLVFLALATSVFFWIRDHDISGSRKMAARALSILPSDPEESLRLSAEAVRKRPTTEAEYALRQSLIESRLRRVLEFKEGSGLTAAFTPDGSRLFITKPNGDVTILDSSGVGRARVLRGDDGWSPAFSPNGKRVIIQHEGSYRVYDIGQEVEGIGASLRVPPPKQVADFRADKGLGTTPTFSNDGRLFATTNDNIVVVRGIKGKVIGRFPFSKGIVDEVAFDPETTRIAAVTFAGEAAVWTLRGKRVKRSLVGHHDVINSVAFSPDRKLIVTASDDHTARVWDARTGRSVRVIRSLREPMTTATFSPDGSLLLAADRKTTRVFRVGSWETLAIRPNTDIVQVAVFSPDSGRVVTAGRDGAAWVWSAHSGETLFQLRGHTDQLLSAAFSPDGTRIVTASDDRTVRLWDATTGTKLGVPGGYIGSAVFSPDGAWIAVSTSEGVVRVFDRKTLRHRFDFRHKDAISQVAFSPNSRLLVTANRDGTATVWSLRTGRTVPPALRHGEEDEVITAQFSPDGRRVVTASLGRTAEAGGTAKIWRLGAGGSQVILDPKGTATMTSAVFSPDGTHVVTAGGDGLSRVWDVRGRSAEQVRVLSGHRGAATSAVYSRDGKMILVTSLDKTAIIYDAQTGKLERVLRGHTAPVWAGAFSAGGTRVITAGSDETTRIWETRTGKTLGVLHWHASIVNSVAFDPRNGSIVLSASDDGSAKIGKCETCAPIADLLRIAEERLRQLKAQAL
jgi:WD40 repeat protein